MTIFGIPGVIPLTTAAEGAAATAPLMDQPVMEDPPLMDELPVT
jgi:hypothetical protein